MTVQDFTGSLGSLVPDLLTTIGKKEFSDIIDDAGHQYVDLVMEGGGILGIALVGYTYVLEEAGLRFLRIGGTSAGAINAMLLAALGTMEECKSEGVIEDIANLDMFSFVDGGEGAKRLVHDFLNHAGTLPLALDATLVLHKLWTGLGLNTGNVFRDWVTARLSEKTN